MEQNESGCEQPQAPALCVNNCGFFGTAATMNMCSKCYKDLFLKQEQAKLAASSFQSILKGSSSSVTEKESGNIPPPSDMVGPQAPECVKNEEVKKGPNRCGTCKKRLGLTGFTCRCGSTFCSVHRYSDKHECTFDYRLTGQEAIAKANPLVKADKINKI